MENASKALIIAGAVLIALLVIAVSTRIFYSTTGTTEQVESSMATTEVSTFNNQFLAFVGPSKSRGQVIALLNAVIVNNSKNPNHPVSINGDATISSLRNLINGVTDGEYTVSIAGNNEDGYITNITYSL